jgi:hypothetical protein
MRFRYLVPNLPLMAKRWKLMNKQHFQVSPRSLSLFNLWRLAHHRQTFRFPRWRTFVSSEVCPLPPESSTLSQPKFMFIAAQAPPRPEDPLPPSTSIIDCSKLLCDTVCDSATGLVTAPVHVHHYVELLWPWCLDNSRQAVYTHLVTSSSSYPSNLGKKRGGIASNSSVTL